MFAALIVKPQAKTAARSSDISALRRATAYGHDRDIEKALTSQRAPQTGPRFPDNESSGAARGFSKIPLYPPGWMGGSERPSSAHVPRLTIQAKLKVGAVDDPLEHEADSVADQVMRMPAPEVATASAPPQVSRKAPPVRRRRKNFKKRKPDREPPPARCPASCMRCCARQGNRSMRQREPISSRASDRILAACGCTPARPPRNRRGT